jgi:hypothetical protein
MQFGNDDLLSEKPRGRISMDLFESTTHSFIVKVWLEDGDHPKWRGHITHVPSGERRYLENMGEITNFIAPYLEQMGVEPGLLRRVKRWLNHWKLY